MERSRQREKRNRLESVGWRRTDMTQAVASTFPVEEANNNINITVTASEMKIVAAERERVAAEEKKAAAERHAAALHARFPSVRMNLVRKGAFNLVPEERIDYLEDRIAALEEAIKKIPKSS